MDHVSPDIQQLTLLLIPLLTALTVAGLKKVTTQIPSWVLPMLTPVIGILIKMLGDRIGIDLTGGLGTAYAAGAGLAGVGVRESYDQGKGKLKAVRTARMLRSIRQNYK